MGIILSIIVLGFVIAIHEGGHFLVAKLCKVGVIEFAIGFGKLLYTRRYGDTKYSLRAIPLGGYVRMAGDDPRALHEPKLDEDLKEEKVGSPEKWAQGEADEFEKKLLADKSCWFLNKPVWAKMAVVIAGPAANLISAFIIGAFTLWIFGATVPIDLPVIGQVVPGYPADKAGFKPGDKVVAIDGTAIGTWLDLSTTVQSSAGKELTVAIERRADKKDPNSALEKLDLKVTGIQEQGEIAFLEGTEAKSGYKIGISVAGKRIQVGFGEAFLYAGEHIGRLSVITLRGIVGLIAGKISLKNIGGPIFIFGETLRSAQAGIADLLEFIVFLSISLAVLNLLPVPVLDGGHLVFFAIEGLKGSPVSLRMHELANQAGMVLLLALTAVAVGNDVLRLFHAF